MIYGLYEGWFVAGFFQSTYMQILFWPILLHKNITVSTYKHEHVHLVRNQVGFYKQKAFHMSKLSTQAYVEKLLSAFGLILFKSIKV